MNVSCDNCNWQGTDEELARQLCDTPDLGERLDPGSVVPAGECPDCGCLAYIVVVRNRRKTDKPQRREQQTALDL